MEKRWDGYRGGKSLSFTKGLTLIEIMMVMVILVVAILGFAYGLGVNVQEVSVTKQSSVAMNAARSKVEEMKGHTFQDLLTDYGPNSANATFAVAYEEEEKTIPLEPEGGGDAGAIIFCVDETAVPDDFAWVGSYDLNGDGDSLDVDVSSDYRVLPTIVRTSWVDVFGARHLEVKTVLFGPKYPEWEKTLLPE
jgi:prepilin-type N-terminal cleavage/methylation domain-containing protein